MKLSNRLFHFVETLPTSDRVILKALCLITLGTLFYVLAGWSVRSSISIPERGGMVTEGIIGTPRFINPLLAATTADKDMVSLVYAGLLTLGEDGTLVPDMAESVTVSDDGLTYNVILKQGLTFHDGTTVTADDVIFTVLHAQDPALKSPLRANWEGVTTERISEYELNFVLSGPYAPFLENLTLGILPRHVWEFATSEELPFSQHNSEPIGSGPYEIQSIERNQSGIPESYVLAPFPNYHNTRPHIEALKLLFFSNEEALVDALKQKKIDSAASLSPASVKAVMDAPGAKDFYALYETPLPRTFAVFFNQNETPIFRDSAVRQALNAALDRERMLEEVLGGYGLPIDGPIPPGFGVEPSYTATSSLLERLETARGLLRAGGWKLNETSGLWEKKDGTDTKELKFSISTVNTTAFEQTATILKETWGQLGIPVDIKKFEQSDLTQTVIRPRKFETLLFGVAVGREFDFYSFWHSSQRNDPGLNIALYANITTDSLLSEARAKTSAEERGALALRFAEEMKKDVPALFLYVPEFIYIAPKTTHNISFKGIAAPHERFSQVTDWYTNTESVWPMFVGTP